MNRDEFESYIVNLLKQKFKDINIAWSGNYDKLPPNPYFVSVEELKNSEFLIWIVRYSASVTDEELQNVEYMYKTIVNLKDISEIYGSEVQKVESYFKGDDDVYYHASNSHIVQCPFIVRLRKGI